MRISNHYIPIFHSSSDEEQPLFIRLRHSKEEKKSSTKWLFFVWLVDMWTNYYFTVGILFFGCDLEFSDSDRLMIIIDRLLFTFFFLLIVILNDIFGCLDHCCCVANCPGPPVHCVYLVAYENSNNAMRSQSFSIFFFFCWAWHWNHTKTIKF